MEEELTHVSQKKSQSEAKVESLPNNEDDNEENGK
jgi:hypothetical protein